MTGLGFQIFFSFLTSHTCKTAYTAAFLALQSHLHREEYHGQYIGYIRTSIARNQKESISLVQTKHSFETLHLSCLTVIYCLRNVSDAQRNLSAVGNYAIDSVKSFFTPASPPQNF